jgi:hypothetical protein
MDTALFVIALILFAALYIGIGVYLLWSLLITLMVLMAYMAARYKNVAENYPYNMTETLTSVLLIATTWTVFIIVGPKDPLPFIGSSFTYTSPTAEVVSGVIDAVIVFVFILLIVMAVLVPWLERSGMQGAGGGGGGGGEGGNITVGT